jgi:hypothetical protein
MNDHEPCRAACPGGDCANCIDYPISVRLQAKDLLDGARDGLDVAVDRINWALRVSGDLNQPAPARIGAEQ